MQDVSRVVGSPIVLYSKLKQRDFKLRGFTFESLGGIQNQMLRDRRKIKFEAAKELADMLPAEDRADLLERARSEAEKLAYVSNDEMQEFLTTDTGAIYFLWFLFEQDYPGVVSRGDVLQMMANGDITKETLQELLSAALGGGPAGNLTGQGSTSAVPPRMAQAVGATLSGSFSSRRKKGGSASRRAKRKESR